MALTWDLGKIKNYEEICFSTDEDGNEKMTPQTEAMIWLTMSVGIGKITESNASQFYSRVRFYETMFGSFLISFDENGKKHHPITPEDVVNHIGLHTNVSLESDASFKTRMFKNFMHDAGQIFQSAKVNSDD